MDERERNQEILFNKYLSELSNPDMIGEVGITCKLRLPYLVGSGRISQEQYESLLRAAINNINNQIPLFDEKIRFGTEEDEKRFRIETIVHRLVQLLPSEETTLSRHKEISYTKKHEDEILNVVFSADTLSPTVRKNGLRVTEKTVLILRVLEIPHTVIN